MSADLPETITVCGRELHRFDQARWLYTESRYGASVEKMWNDKWVASVRLPWEDVSSTWCDSIKDAVRDLERRVAESIAWTHHLLDWARKDGRDG